MKNRFKTPCSAKIIITVLFVVFAAVLGNNGVFCASWNDIAASAGNNDSLVSAAKQLDSSKWSYNKAWSSFLPQVSLSGSYGETISPTSSATSKSYAYGLTATQYLFKGFQNYNSLRSSYASYQNEMAAYKNAESETYYELRVAFIGLYIAQENLALSKQILARLKENSRLIKLRYENGREDKGNLLTTTASQKEAEYAVNAAQRELELARLKLSQLCGKDIAKAEGDLKISMEAEPDYAALVLASPSYNMAKYQLEIAEIADQNTLGEFLPSVSVSGSYRKDGSVWPPTDENRSWSLNLSYSLFPGGANIADKFINSLNLDAARRDFESSRKSLLYDIEDAYRNLKDSVDAYEVKRTFLVAAEERSKIADAKYLNGLITYDEWNRITKDHITSQKDSLRGKSTALISSAAWKKIYGGKEI